ncbi:MAG: DNA recombination protein RmuC, partial [Clostridiales bacterium]
MEIIILIVNLLLLAIVCFLSIKIIALLKNNQQGDNNQDLQASEKRLKEELAQLRQDIYAINNDFGNKLLQQIISLNNINEQKIENLRQTMDQKLTEMNSANSENIHQLRSALDNRLIQMNEQNNQNLSRIRSTLDERIGQIQESNAQKMDALRDTVDTKLSQMQDNNEKRLESMRETVDEKLHATLEKRLGESFNQVSERLEQVHKGLGEMQNLASGVGDLKKVLANVRNRGTWGEVQLGNLLEDMLSPQQYETNVATNPMAPNNRVEYAVKLPGKEEGHPVYLPIDAKYPLEDYQLLLDAQEKGDLP